MKRTIVSIPASRIIDEASFHSVFDEALGFPGFYGCNMSAWIDCLTSVDDPASGMTRVTVSPGDLLSLRIEGAEAFRDRHPDLYRELVECAAFVNERRVEQGEPPVVELVMDCEPTQA